MGEHGIQTERTGDRSEFARRVEAQRLNGNGEAPEMKRGWRLGPEDFVERLAERLGRAGSSCERAAERNETDEQLALRIVREELARAGIAENELSALAKGNPLKVAMARRLRAETPMTRTWSAARLARGSASYLSALLNRRVDDSKL
jgi:hypothetical protein